MSDRTVGANWRPIPDDVRGTARQLTEELRGIKDRSGLSLTQIGSRTHYSKASWERWFNGKRLITEHALESLAVSVDESARLLKPLLERALLEAEQETGPHVDRAEQVDRIAQGHPVDPMDRVAATPLQRDWRRHTRSGVLAMTSALIGAALGAYVASPDDRTTPQALGARPSVSASASRSAAPPPCEGVGCSGKDPQSTGCVTDEKSLTTRNVGTVVIYLHYSARCRAAWGGLTDAAPGDTATIFTSVGDQQTAKVHWGYDNYSMMVDASDPNVGLKVCGVQPHGEGCTSTLSVPFQP